MPCHKCGHYNLKAALFCSNCGQHLNEGEAVPHNTEDKSSATTSNTNSADKLLAAFVGQKYYSFYRDKWFKSHNSTLDGNKKPLNILSLNLAALLFGIFWLFYRKMYKEALVVLIIVSLVDLGLMHLVGMDVYDRINEYAFWIAELILLGFLGNYLYFRHTVKKIKQAERLLSDRAVIEQQLIEQGGTTWIGAFYGIVLEMLIPYIMYYLLAPSWFW